MLFVICLFLMVASSQAQLAGTGPCGDFQGMSNYEPSKILGGWYGYVTYHDCTRRAKCKRTEFIDLHDGSMIDDERVLSNLTNTFQVRHRMKVLTYTGNGAYNTSGPVDSYYFNHTLQFWGTDYVSYFVKGACINVGPSSLIFAWGATRSPNPPQSAIAGIYGVLDKMNLPRQYLYFYNQTQCPEDY